MEIVYRAGYKMDALLRHEAEHARYIFAAKSRPGKEAIIFGATNIFAESRYAWYRWRQDGVYAPEGSLRYKLQESAAERVEGDRNLKRKYRKIITVERHKRRQEQ